MFCWLRMTNCLIHRVCVLGICRKEVCDLGKSHQRSACSQICCLDCCQCFTGSFPSYQRFIKIFIALFKVIQVVTFLTCYLSQLSYSNCSSAQVWPAPPFPNSAHGLLVCQKGQLVYIVHPAQAKGCWLAGTVSSLCWLLTAGLPGAQHRWRETQLCCSGSLLPLIPKPVLGALDTFRKVTTFKSSYFYRAILQETGCTLQEFISKAWRVSNG